jgi:putative ABC transport system substrate-binding protein
MRLQGLVSSLNRPGGNITGVSFYDIPVTGKRLALLRELIPKAETIAVLQDPTAATFQTESRAIEAAVGANGQKIILFKAGSGLVSYRASQTDAYRRAGVYVARILNGEKPGDLPVELPTKFELSINLRTAKALGLTVPPTLLARAHEVIE